MQTALATRDLQAVVRIYLDCTALTQEAVALLIDRDQGTVSKILHGRRSRSTIEDIEAFRDGLRIPGHLLGLQPGHHELTEKARLVGASTLERGDVPTKRRDFNKAVVLAVLGISGTLGEDITALDAPAQIGMEHVQVLNRALEQLEAQDSLVGGDTLFEVTTWLYSRAYAWLHTSAYSVEVGEALQSVVGELGAWVGWMAYDADRHSKAREHFQETLLLARMADDHPLEVRVLSYMALQSTKRDRPREALMLARTAQRVAAGWGTPRLLALLHLRAARAFAAMKNESAFLRELARAKNRFEHGLHADDPLFINFVTSGELAGITALSYLDLKKPERASELFRSIIDHPDPAFRRNTSMYTVYLADARLRMGDISEASKIGMSAIPLVSALDSSRIRRRIRELRDDAARHVSSVPKARDFVEMHDADFGATGVS